MSTAINPIDRLQELGGRVFLDGDSIRYRIPSGSLEAEQLLSEIRKDRNATIALLRDRENKAPCDFSPEPVGNSHPAEGITGHGLPLGPCFACHSKRFWISIHGATVCAVCHPPANGKLVRQWVDLSNPEAPKQPEPHGEKQGNCPFALPKGVSLVGYEKKEPPVVITTFSVVNDPEKFIKHALAELDARLHRPLQIRAGDSTFTLLSKLADCGLELRLGWVPEARDPGDKDIQEAN